MANAVILWLVIVGAAPDGMMWCLWLTRRSPINVERTNTANTLLDQVDIRPFPATTGDLAHARRLEIRCPASVIGNRHGQRAEQGREGAQANFAQPKGTRPQPGQDGVERRRLLRGGAAWSV
jgi:hypothetical protein